MPVLYIQMYMYEDNLKLLPVLNIQMYMYEDNLNNLPGKHTDVQVHYKSYFTTQYFRSFFTVVINTLMVYVLPSMSLNSHSILFL